MVLVQDIFLPSLTGKTLKQGIQANIGQLKNAKLNKYLLNPAKQPAAASYWALKAWLLTFKKRCKMVLTHLNKADRGNSNQQFQFSASKIDDAT